MRLGAILTALQSAMSRRFYYRVATVEKFCDNRRLPYSFLGTMKSAPKGIEK
jgi:hypothetical protein